MDPEKSLVVERAQVGSSRFHRTGSDECHDDDDKFSHQGSIETRANTNESL